MSGSGAASVPRRQYIDLLFVYLRPHRSRAALLAVLLLLTTGLQLLNPLILRYFIDTAAEGGAVRTLLLTAGAFIVVAFAGQVLTVGATYVGEWLGWTATNALRADLARHCLDLDMSFHNERTPGELIERIDGDVTTLSNFFSRFVILVVGSVLLLLGVLVLLFWEDWRVGLALTLFALFALLVLRRLQHIAVPALAEERQASAELFGFLEERLAGIRDLRANGAGAYTMGRYHVHMRTLYRKARSAWMKAEIVWMSTTMLFAIGYALAFGLGALLFRGDAITIGTVYLIFHYTELLRRPIEELSSQLQDLQRATAGIGRVRELYDTRSALHDGPGDPLPSGPLAVDFRHVSFGYSPGELVLRDVSMRLAPGEVLGLLGRTGSGKSTIARLLFRLYDPTEGEIMVGGVNVRRARLTELHAVVGMVTQQVQLFQGTVRDNLTLFTPEIADAQILHVLREVGLSHWLAVLPDGLDSPLSSGNAGLSAGEAQLLAFARVFLRAPQLVVLDEASSRLDPATERLVEHAVGRLLEGRTAIIIAHRLATVQRADHILILEDGRVIEHGRREDLASDPSSHFHHLMQTGETMAGAMPARAPDLLS
ncbi:MAG: ABC transporter ATP-binding protein [Chloroflexia bacterium]|nr:ABC transporter ATP-binding protein [Chloroflexia bacterium]